jgi:hypothetical protein
VGGRRRVWPSVSSEEIAAATGGSWIRFPWLIYSAGGDVADVGDGGGRVVGRLEEIE